MATLGVVNFSDKINVLQQSSLENYSDQSSNKRQIIFLRANPNNTTSNSDILLANSSTNQTKKKTPTSSTASKTMTRIHNPPPVAVARRNARERNRVKQVNNGFATLRQHIPTNIAATYESGNGRGSNKKLSKVETLRMAVEYIKSLEKLLNLTDENSTNNNSTSSVINYNTNSISPNSSQFNSTYAYSTGTDDDDDLRSPRNHILKKNNYQLMYEDEENIHPLKMEQMEEHLLQESNLRGDLQLTDSHDMALLNSIENNTSLSPEVYSEHSLSPGGLNHETKTFIPVFNVPNNQNLLPSFSQIAYDRIPQVKSELLSPNGQQFNEDLQKSDQRVCIITRNEVVNEHNSVIDVMWWDPTQQQR